MNHMKKLIYSLGIATALFSTIATADLEPDNDVLAEINNSFSAGLTFMHFNYREAPDGLPINIYGPAYGLAIGTRNVFFQRMYTDIAGEFAFGNLKYEGFLQNPTSSTPSQPPPNIPYQTKQKDDFINVDAKLGVIILDYNLLQVIPYGGFGFRYWKQDTGHKYYNFKAMAGAKLNFAPTDNWAFSPYANIGTTLGAHAKPPVYIVLSNGTTGAYQGTPSLSLGKKMIREFGLEINYRVDHELFVVGTISHTHFEYGRSAAQDVGVVKGEYEPDSTTNELRFGLGMRYGFL